MPGGVVNATTDKYGRLHSEKTGRFISKYSYDGQIPFMNTFNVSQIEFQKVVSEINTNYETNKNKKNIVHYTSDYIYKVENHGFNNYIFYDKIMNETPIEDI